MEQTFAIAVTWVGLALIATFLGAGPARIEVAAGLAATTAARLPGDDPWRASRPLSRFCFPLISRGWSTKSLSLRVAQSARSRTYV
jgi:hypothetical protein